MIGSLTIKVRVHEFAREVGVESKEVMRVLRLLGYNPKSPSSTIPLLPLEYNALRAYISKH